MLVALGLRRDGKKEVIDYRPARGESATEWERFLADFAADLNDVIPSDLFVRHTEPLAIMPSAYQVPTKSAHSRCWVDLAAFCQAHRKREPRASPCQSALFSN